jgi:ankyrin repeat protein
VQALLLEGAADVHHVVSNGRTALMEAAAGGHAAVVEALLDLGMANPNSCCAGRGSHALLEAARGSHVEAAQRLLSHGARVDLADRAGDTALLVAARCA